MNGFDEYYDAPLDGLDDETLLGDGPVTTTGDDYSDLDPADIPF